MKRALLIMLLPAACSTAVSEPLSTIGDTGPADAGSADVGSADVGVSDAGQVDVGIVSTPYVALVLAPDQITLGGPASGRTVAVYGRLPDGLLEVVTDASAISQAPETASVRRGRIRGVAPGATRVDFTLADLTASVAVDVLDGAPPHAAQIVDRRPGPGAGFGADRLPEVVLGAPQGGGAIGSLDVVSLGRGGSITLGFGDLMVYDGPGPDLIVFENPFLILGTRMTFAEPAHVEVSADGQTWSAYACDADAWPHPGCAGVGAVTAGPFAPEVDPTDPLTAGGDAFDLSDLSDAVPFATAIRITDAATSTSADGNNVGFDLDAVSLVHTLPISTIGIEAIVSQLRLRHGESALIPRVDAHLSDGDVLRGVAVKPSLSMSTGPVRLESGLLRATATGTTTLTLSAGPYTTRILIEVSP